MAIRDIALGEFETGCVTFLMSLYMGSAAYSFIVDAVDLSLDYRVELGI